MKKFLGKKVESLRVGMHKLGDKTHVLRVEEDPEFLDRKKKLSKVQEELDQTLSSVDLFAKSFEKFATSLAVVSGSFATMFNPSHNANYENSRQFKLSVDSTAAAIHKFVHVGIPTYVIKPLFDCKARIDELNVIAEKRYRRRVLLSGCEKKLESAKAKGKDTTVAEERMNIQKQKYLKRHDAYIAGVTELYDNRVEIFGSCMSAFQFYMLEVIDVMNREIKDKMTDLPIEALRDKLPSLERIPDANPA